MCWGTDETGLCAGLPLSGKALSFYLNRTRKETNSLSAAEYLGLHEATKMSLGVRTVRVVCPVQQKALKFREQIYNHPSSHFPLPQTKTLNTSCVKQNIL